MSNEQRTTVIIRLISELADSRSNRELDRMTERATKHGAHFSDSLKNVPLGKR